MRGRRWRRARPRRRRRAALVACLLAVVLLGTGCGSAGPSPAPLPTPAPTARPTAGPEPTGPEPTGPEPAGSEPGHGGTAGAPNPGTGETGSSGGSGETSGEGQGSPPSPDVAASERLAQARRDALRDGLIAYRPPSPMRQGDVQRVVVRASGVEERGRLLAGLPPTPPGQVVTTPLDVGLTLSAELAGEGFAVTPVGAGDLFRPSLAGDVAEWQWDITPTESGAKHLTLIVRSYYGDVSAAAAVRYVDAPVQVGFNLWYSTTRLLSSPSWAATGLTVPVLVTAAFALRRRRRRAHEQQSATADTPPPPRSPAGSDGRGYL